MNRNAAVLLTLAVLCGATARGYADTPNEPLAGKIDAYVKSEIAKHHIAGASVAVVMDGKLALAKGYGLVDLERSVPATENNVYEIGSMTKQFTATAILLLVQDGKIGLEDKISKYLDGTPDTWKNITVRHLLTHTSGIKGYTEVGDFMTLARNDHTEAEIVKMVSALPLEFAPGEKWKYSNTGYYLLGMIVEKASGKPYMQFLSERILKPLGMDKTRDCNPSDIIPNRALGYDWDGTKYTNGELLHPSAAGGAGMLVTTVLDIVKWDAALNTDKILPHASLEQMWTSAKLNDGKATGYGFGWGLGDQNGHKLISHGGGTAAFSSIISRYVDDKLTVIVLTNRPAAPADVIARGIASLCVPALTPPPDKAITDSDPQTTQKLKDVVVSAANGTLDPNLFTPEARAELFPDKAKEATGFLKPLGPLQSFTLLGRREEDKHHLLRYKAVYKSMSLTFQFALTEDGKIGGIGIRPE